MGDRAFPGIPPVLLLKVDISYTADRPACLTGSTTGCINACQA